MLLLLLLFLALTYDHPPPIKQFHCDVEAVEGAAVDGAEGAARDDGPDDEPGGVSLPVLARARWRSSCSSRVLRSIWSARTPRTTTSNI